MHFNGMNKISKRFRLLQLALNSTVVLIHLSLKEKKKPQEMDNQAVSIFKNKIYIYLSLESNCTVLRFDNAI